MATVPLKQRVEALESEVARLKAKLENGPMSSKPWWEQIWVHDATLLTRNAVDFGKVPDLRIEDWTV